MTSAPAVTGRGAIIPSTDLAFQPLDGCQVACAVGPHLGAVRVRLDVVRIPPHHRWHPEQAKTQENIVVVFSGSGTGHVGPQHRPVESADVMYSPTGHPYALHTGDQPMTAYIWSSRLPTPHTPPTAPRHFSRLWNEETQLKGFSGTEQGASGKTATMNFLFWPGTGSPRLCLHCGFMRPGEYFNVHTHPHSEEAFIAFEGEGQLHLDGHWHDAAPGDVLFAPPGVPHGTRHYDTPDAPRFATCGGPTPFDPVLYERAGVSAKVR